MPLLYISTIIIVQIIIMIKIDTRVLNIPLCPLFKVKMDAYKSMCPVVITKDNFQKVLNENPYKK